METDNENHSQSMNRGKKKLFPSMIPEIAEMRVEGKTWKEIANKFDVTDCGIRKFVGKKEMKKWVEEIRDELITSALKPTKENIQALIHDYPQLGEGQTKEHAFRAMKWILDSAGITPTMAESQFTINLYQTSNVIISPMMQEVLKNFADTLKLESSEVIDVPVGVPR